MRDGDKMGDATSQGTDGGSSDGSSDVIEGASPEGEARSRWSTWTFTAHELPEHAAHPIHTDESMRAAVFPGVHVAGVTTYAYLVQLPLTAWGVSWLDRGAAEIRLRAPVYDGERLVCEHEPPQRSCPEANADPGDVASFRVGVSGRVRVGLELDRTGSTLDVPVTPRSGTCLEPFDVRLEGDHGGVYAPHTDGSLAVAAPGGRVHPAVWVMLANRFVPAQLAESWWVHTRTRVRHLGPVRVGAEASVHATVIDRFERPSGERAVLDVRVEVHGAVVAAVEHEAIVRMTSSS